MSFTAFLQDDPQLTREQVMATLIQVADELDMPDKRGAAVIAGMIVSQESGVENGAPPHERRFWCPANPADQESLGIQHDSLSDDGRSVGYFQQQKGPNGELWWGSTASEMDLHSAATSFMQRLKTAGYDASNPTSAASSGCAIQNPADHPGYIASASGWWDDINSLYDTVSGSTPGGTVTTPTDPRLAALQAARPDFNEFANWCENHQDRDGTAIDLWLIHTQEGAEGDDNAALDLSNFLISTTGTGNPVSYHYAIRQASDGGVTVVDCVDTDQASWSVANSNNRSINACFAGMDASMSRDEWLTQSKAIDVAAYLAVADCIKYGIDPKVIAGPAYPSDPPGISDHRYCTDHLKDGNTHVDVGDNFPWDLFAHSVATYWAAANQAAPADPGGGDPAPPPAQADLFEASDSVKQDNILAQTRGRWGLLGTNKTGPNAGKDRTLLEAIGFLVDQAEGTDNTGNGDFSW